MNLQKQKRNLIIFLTLCMLILGAFILVLTNTTRTSAATCDHDYNGTWFYGGKDANGEYIHYQYCNKCQIRKEEECQEIGFNIKNYYAVLQAFGLETQFRVNDYDEDDCFSFCGICRNISSTTGTTTVWSANIDQHDFEFVPYEDATDVEKPNYTGTCTTKGEVVEKCTICGLRRMKDGELDPSRHDINIANPQIFKYATCTESGYKVYFCLDCGKFVNTVVIPPDPDLHVYKWTLKTKSEHYKKCKFCGEIDESTTEKHVWRNVTEADTRNPLVHDILYSPVVICDKCLRLHYPGRDRRQRRRK